MISRVNDKGDNCNGVCKSKIFLSWYTLKVPLTRFPVAKLTRNQFHFHAKLGVINLEEVYAVFPIIRLQKDKIIQYT